MSTVSFLRSSHTSWSQKTRISRRLDLDKTNSVNNISHSNVDLSEETLRTEKNILFKRLNPVENANYDINRGYMDGSRTEIIGDLVSWAVKPVIQGSPSTSSTADNILWVYGTSGVGKTPLADSICHQLHNSKNLGGSFFCQWDDPALSEPERILQTLIYRLAEVFGSWCSIVAQILRDNPRLTPESASGELLLKGLAALKRRPSRTLVLVIDALDECGTPDSRRRLLGCLLDACRRVNWLKFIVISRPKYDIQSFFEASGATIRELTKNNQARQNIRYLMKKRLKSLVESRGLPNGWPGENRREKVIARSRGLFIYIESLSRFLGASKDPDGLLDQILEDQLEEGDTELYKLYSTAITSQVGQETEMFQSIVRAIIAVAPNRPLCDETLAVLLREKPHIIKAWIDDLSAILYRDVSENGGIRVRNPSILEFLTDSSCPPDIRVDIKQANAELSRYCLTTMTRELKFNICEFETSFLLNSEVKDLGDRVRLKISDALQYSCSHWSSHLSFDLDPASDAVSDLMNKFFAGEIPLYWLEVLSVTGNTPSAIPALRQIKECNEKFDMQTRDRIKEVLRFVLAFSTPISTSAPHIYLSTLPFMPLESSLWQWVYRLFPRILNVCTVGTEIEPGRSRVWHGHTRPVSTIAYSPSGQNIVSGSWDNTIRIWDATRGAPVAKPLREHTEWAKNVAYLHNGVPVDQPLHGHTDWVNGVAYSPNDQSIVSGSDDNTIRMWDAKTGTAMGEPMRGHTSVVDSVAYSPNGRHVVSGSRDNMIRIWDATTGAPVGKPLRWHTDWVKSVAYSPSGQHIISGSRDKTIRIWDANSGVPVGEPLRGHTDWVNSVVYSPNGQYIVSGSRDDTIRIWDATTGSPVGEPLRGHTNSVMCVACSPNGRNIVSGSWDSTIRIWDVTTGALVGKPLRGHTDWVKSIAYSPNGQHIVSGSGDNTIRIWDMTMVSQNDSNMLHDFQALSSLLTRIQASGSVNYSTQSTPSGFGIASKLIDSDGWVRCNEGLLFWVPEDYRNSLSSSAILTIPTKGHHKCVRVNFDNFRYGSLWTTIRKDVKWAQGEGYQSMETIEATSSEESDESSDTLAGNRSIRTSVYGVKPDREIVRFWIDSSSTYGEIHDELAGIYNDFAIVVLEAHYGPEPYWQECAPNQPIGEFCRDIYAVAVKGPSGAHRYTLGVVRTAELDYPIAIFDSSSEPAGTVLQAITSSQPDLINQIKQVTYYSSLQDVRQHNHNYENLRNDLLHTFPTTFCITVDDAEQPFTTSRPSESIPPFLQAPLVRCKNLLQRGYNLEISPLQTIFVLRAALHLIISLSTAIAPMLESGYLSANSQTVDDEDHTDILRVAPSLAEEIHRIVIAIEGHVKALEGSPPEEGQTIWDIDRIFVSLCGDFPGAVTIRRSQGTLEDLKARDAEDSFYLSSSNAGEDNERDGSVS